MVDFNLYLITDRTQTAGRELPAVVAEALRGGVRAVQLREKDLPPKELLKLARVLRGITRDFSSRLLINGNADVALAVDADGVHTGATSMPVTELRRLLGPAKLIGYSAHSIDEALRAESEGADFITFGPVYQTPSKSSFGPPLGLSMFAEASRTLKIPVFALGGVKKSSIDEVMAAGATGIALISGIIAAREPQLEAEAMLRSLNEHAVTS